MVHKKSIRSCTCLIMITDGDHPTACHWGRITNPRPSFGVNPQNIPRPFRVRRANSQLKSRRRVPTSFLADEVAVSCLFARLSAQEECGSAWWTEAHAKVTAAAWRYEALHTPSGVFEASAYLCSSRTSLVISAHLHVLHARCQHLNATTIQLLPLRNRSQSCARRLCGSRN